MEMNGDSAKKQPSTPAWHSDRVLECSSVEVLVSWLITDDNYARWTNSSQQGELTKYQLCDEINGLLQAQRIQHRNRSAIYRKVRFIEKAVEEAWRLLSENGACGSGALDRCGPSVKKKILGFCPYFELLARVIGAPKSEQSDAQDRAKNQKAPSSVEDSAEQDEAHKFDLFFASQSIENGDGMEDCVVDGQEACDADGGADSDETIVIDAPSATATTSDKKTSRWDDGRCFRPWHNDRVRGKSSFDIVLPWLNDKANYARWKRSASSTLRTTICAEINERLRAEGIQHRSVEGIRRKIMNMEKDVAEAQRFLSHNGFRGLTSLEACDQKIKDEVLAICPDFRLLAPVMSIDRVHAVKARLKDTRRSGSKGLNNPGTERDRVEPTKISGQRQRSDQTPIKCDPTVSRKPIRAFRELDSSYGLEVKIQQSRLRFEREKRAIELESARNRARIEFRAAQEKQESELVVERALARQTLFNAGISRDEVEELLPAKRLRVAEEER